MQSDALTDAPATDDELQSSSIASNSIDITPTAPATPAEAGPVDAAGAVDLDGIERDLAGVEVALVRLDDGTYWTDEVTGEPLPDELLAERPTARRRSES